ncbi:MAG TPA: hypothetical protein VE244_13370 [Nitrososphaeraceae archaeon]|jgi:hypothetical protein|nr:hypothetical protein [Nitrososphaeraceae archaeon]
MKIGIRLPKTGEDHVTKEISFILQKRLKMLAALNFYGERICNNHCQEIND